jgi:catechol-2,3-dioxygenase
MELARVILFTGQMEAMSRFYGQVLGLKVVTEEKGWREFAAGDLLCSVICFEGFCECLLSLQLIFGESARAF